MAYLVDSVLNFDERVRYYALVDRAGSRIRDKLRDGVVRTNQPTNHEPHPDDCADYANYLLNSKSQLASFSFEIWLTGVGSTPLKIAK